MNKMLAWITTPVFAINFLLILIFIHPLLVFSFCFHRPLAEKAVVLMNILQLWNLRIFCGTSFTVDVQYTLPKNRPIIFVSNHQTMFDISMFVVYFAEYGPKYIAKRELGRWIPTISFALRNLDFLLIDRNDQRKSLSLLSEFGKKIETQRWSAVIFPEGTRARDGKIKLFKQAGLKVLLKSAPSALIVPVVSDGGWHLFKNGIFPVTYGVNIKFRQLSSIELNDFENIGEAINECEKRINEGLLAIRD